MAQASVARSVRDQSAWRRVPSNSQDKITDPAKSSVIKRKCSKVIVARHGTWFTNNCSGHRRLLVEKRGRQPRGSSSPGNQQPQQCSSGREEPRPSRADISTAAAAKFGRAACAATCGGRKKRVLSFTLGWQPRKTLFPVLSFRVPKERKPQVPPPVGLGCLRTSRRSPGQNPMLR